MYSLDLLGFGASAQPALPLNNAVWGHQVCAFLKQVIQRPAVVSSIVPAAPLALTIERPISIFAALLSTSIPFIVVRLIPLVRSRVPAFCHRLLLKKP